MRFNTPRTGPKRMAKIALGLVLLFFGVFPLGAQTGKYVRKSISYPNVLVQMEKQIRLSPPERDYYLEAIHDGISIARFDYNVLPERIERSFQEAYESYDRISDDELLTIIQKTMVPELLRILDVNKELRAENLVTETQRNSFIALKAKELGVTAEQIEQVLNASYIYVPYLSRYDVDEDKEKKEISVTAAGGVLWFHLIAVGEPRLEKVGNISSRGNGSAKTNDNYSYRGHPLPAKSKAFHEAVDCMVMNLQVQTRDLDFFKLQAPIAEIERRRVGFPLGQNEGIRIDDPYFVGEWMQDARGKIRFRHSGFVRVLTVSDNREQRGQLSTARAIQKGDWSRGMLMVEHPRLGIDLGFKPRLFRMKVEEGLFASDNFLIYFDDYEGAAVGMDLDLQYNIAHSIGRPGAFAVAGATVGVVPVKSATYSSFADIIFDTPEESGAAGVFHGHLGYLRRLYMGPLALHYELLLGIQHVTLSHKYDDEDVAISNNSVGVHVNLGLEYALNIDWNVGVFAGFQAFPALDLWTVKYDEEEIEVENYLDWAGPKISSISPTFGIYVHFSTPSLPFNPTTAIENNLKEQLR